MKKLIIFLIGILFTISIFGQTIGRLPYKTTRQIYRGDTIESTLTGDSVKYRTNQNRYVFDKQVQINADTLATKEYARAAGGGTAVLNSGFLKWLTDSLTFGPHANSGEASKGELYYDGIYGIALKDTGLSVATTSGTSIYGYSKNSNGVAGYSDTDAGVYGYGNYGVTGEGILVGIYGTSSGGGTGISGNSDTGTGGVFSSTWGYALETILGSYTNKKGLANFHTGVTGDSVVIKANGSVYRYNSGAIQSFSDYTGLTWSKYFQLDSVPIIPTNPKQGQMWLDTADNTMSIKLKNYTLQVGQEMPFKYLNSSGATIGNVKCVYVYSDGTIKLADASKASTAYKMIGVTTEQILNGFYGMVTVQGRVREANTNGMTKGDMLYLSTSGGFTNVKPTSGHIVRIGVVDKVGTTDGVILVDTKQETFARTAVLSENSTSGVTIDTITGITLFGNAKAWDDIAISGFELGSGTSAPVFTTGWAGSSLLGANYFQGTTANDIAYFNIQIPHKCALNDSVRIHFHWGPTTIPVSGDTAVFSFTYSLANTSATFPAATTNIIKVPIFGKAQWSHNVTALLALPTGTGGPSRIINCSLERLYNNASDTYTSNVGVLSIDAHAKFDKLGSFLEY